MLQKNRSFISVKSEKQLEGRLKNQGFKTAGYFSFMRPLERFSIKD
jgi:hypothetical protein